MKLFGEAKGGEACRWTLGGYLLIWAVERLANGAEAAPSDLSASDAAAGRRRRRARRSADEAAARDVVRCFISSQHARDHGFGGGALKVRRGVVGWYCVAPAPPSPSH